LNSPERRSFIETFALPMGLAMLALWVIGMVLIDGAPGWLHFFLTFGVFFVIWGIVVRNKVSARNK
jgi:hypothetical protein